MKHQIRNIEKIILSLGFIFLTQCVPTAIAIGGGATLVGLMCREKGISGTLIDADLSAKVRSNFAKADFEHDETISSKVNISVNNSEVLLTGVVETTKQKMLAEQTVWEVFGVKQVINQLQTKDEYVKNSSYDAFITAKVKTSLLRDKKIHLRSFNYAIRTVNGVVYVMGIAKNEFERDRTLKIVACVPGIKKVVSLVRLSHEVL